MRRGSSATRAARRHPSNGRRHGERGAGIVEFALVAPLLLGLLLGILEVGFGLNDAQSLRSGTSGAGRSAAVLHSPDRACATASTPPNDATRAVVCDVKERVGLSDTRVRVLVPGGWSRGESVVVCSQRRATSLTGFFPFLDGQVMTNRSEFRIERIATDTPVDFAEPAPAGADWSWCTA